MSVVSRIWRSSVGKKFVMAVSGCTLFLFVVGHMVGNLQVFLGPEAINRYGHFLQSNKEILWPVRIVLVTLVGLHIWSAIALSIENKAARPVGYVNNPTPLAATYASRTMLMGGMIVAAFIIYHLLHFTVQVEAVNLTGVNFATLEDAQGHHDVFSMMILGLSKPLVAVFYGVGISLLCLHLSHGVQAMFQSVGWAGGCCPGFPKCLARIVAIVLFVGYLSIPAAILAGYGQNEVQRALKQAVVAKEVGR